jgi:hypothetical protein
MQIVLSIRLPVFETVGPMFAEGPEVSCHLGGSALWMTHQIYGPDSSADLSLQETDCPR